MTEFQTATLAIQKATLAVQGNRVGNQPQHGATMAALKAQQTQHEETMVTPDVQRRAWGSLIKRTSAP